jgi:GrpB-like predicted nucleotidyltransferase (UPF0157 family)
MALRYIAVVPYDPSWERLYEREAARISTVFRDEALGIEHIGSTSIKGIYAKPIIDILVQVKDITRVDGLNSMLAAFNYIPQGENGLVGRRYFTKGGHEVRKYNVHTFQTGHAEIARCLDFRDYLRTHPTEAQAYSELKQALAAQYPHDINGYMAGKDSFIHRTIARAQAWRQRALSSPVSNEGSAREN